MKFIPFLLQAGRIITPSEDSQLQCVFNTLLLVSRKSYDILKFETIYKANKVSILSKSSGSKAALYPYG